ncbi:MAG: DUF4143 domain-containing protein [Lachnospiraceae bacterium]
MQNNKYKPRILDTKIKSFLDTFGAVCIEGPKWCGKTWTCTHHSNSAIFIGDPSGNFQNRMLATLSPSTVLDGDSPRLIDEWQEVPQLWDAVRYKVDQTTKKGQYLLTGSSTPNHKGILHSGAGRIGTLRMRPMSLYESGDSSGKVSLLELCNGNITPTLTQEVPLATLATLIVRGGWPGNLETDTEHIALLPTEYLNAIIADDVFRIDDVKRDTNKMNLLLRSLARNEATTATNKTLKNDIKDMDSEDIDVETVASYLDIFKRLFLLDNQLPFSTNIRSSVRVKQAEKRHFCDPSIACAILKATPDRLIGDLETFGFLFEALCERDLKIYAESIGASLYHYQDYKNREIDAVVEFDDSRWCAFEIKLGANQIDKAASDLIALRNSLLESGSTPPTILCVLCGLSNAAYQREDGVFVVPITALRP